MLNSQVHIEPKSNGHVSSSPSKINTDPNILLDVLKRETAPTHGKIGLNANGEIDDSVDVAIDNVNDRAFSVSLLALVGVLILLMVDAEHGSGFHIDFPTNIWFHAITIMALALLGGHVTFGAVAINHFRQPVVSHTKILVTSIFAMIIANVVVISLAYSVLASKNIGGYVAETAVLLTAKFIYVGVADITFLRLILGEKYHKPFRKTLASAQNMHVRKLMQPKDKIEGKEEGTPKKKSTIQRLKEFYGESEEEAFYYPVMVLAAAMITIPMVIWIFAKFLRIAKEIVGDMEEIEDDLASAQEILNAVQQLCAGDITANIQQTCDAFERSYSGGESINAVSNHFSELEKWIADSRFALLAGFSGGPVFGFIYALFATGHNVGTFKKWVMSAWRGEIVSGFNVTTSRHKLTMAISVEYLAYFVSVHVIGTIFFGFVVAIVIAALAWRETWIFVWHYLPHLVVTILMYIINSIILRNKLGNEVLSDGQAPKKPFKFIFYMVVFAFWHAISGLLAGLARLIIAVLTACVKVCVMDQPVVPGFMSRFDAPFKSFQCLVAMHSRLNNPVKNVAVQHFLNCKSGEGANREKKRGGAKWRAKWNLAYTLVNNPGLVKHCKRGVQESDTKVKITIPDRKFYKS